MFLTVEDYKDHIRLEQDDYDFERELPRFLQAAENTVLKYINRNVFTELPAEPESTDILIDANIETAILDVAGYYFDNKGAYDNDMVNSILDASVGHLRVIEV